MNETDKKHSVNFISREKGHEAQAARSARNSEEFLSRSGPLDDETELKSTFCSSSDSNDKIQGDDINNNLHSSDEDNSDTTMSIDCSKSLGKLDNHKQTSKSSSTSLSQQAFKQSLTSKVSLNNIPQLANNISQFSIERDSDSDISFDHSDKESADSTDDYHDKDSYIDLNESDQDNAIQLLDNLNKQRQDKLAPPRLRARRRQTKQREMIDGQQKELNENIGSSIKFPAELFTFDASSSKNTEETKKKSKGGSILKSSENKSIQCDDNQSLYDRSILFFKNYLSLSSLLRSSQDTTGESQQGQQRHKTRLPINLSNKRMNALSGISIHEGQSSDEQQSDMPANRYRTFDSGDDTIPMATGSRRLSSRSRSRDYQRSSAYTNRYSKLSHHYFKTNNTTFKQSFCQDLKRLMLLLLIVLVSCFLLFKLYQVLTEDYNYLGQVQSPSKLGHFQQYAVATDAWPCAKVGSNLLAKGGSAVDAAIGTLLCMGVVLPNSLGLGGGCLITVYDSKTKQASVIDGREIAPDYATEDMFVNETLKASRGALSVGVPGELAAYEKAHKMFGKLNWTDLFNESITMAEEGVPLVEHLAYALRSPNHAKYITPPLAAIFTNPATGVYYDKGEILAQKELANTLRRIRDNGAQEFYGGLTGQNFIEDLKAQGGKMTLDNLKKYEALVKKPLVYKLADDLTLHTQPPPGSGVVLSIIMRIMKDLGYYKNLKAGESFEQANLYYHRLAEAIKFAYAQRAGLEDQPDDPKRMEQLMAHLNSEQFITEAVQKITNQTHETNYYGGSEYFSEDHGTAHVSVIDSEGNAVAATSSVNLYFGSGLVSPRTGIIYNDVMDDFVSPNIVNKFSLAPSKFNHIRPGKRPLSSMVPSVFTNAEGNVRLVVGGSGGSKITTATATVSLRNCFLNEDIKTAIDGPRIHHQYLPNKIWYELNFPKDLLHALEERGHALQPILDRSSVIMAIASEQAVNATQRHITANSDYRKGGSVDGL